MSTRSLRRRRTDRLVHGVVLGAMAMLPLLPSTAVAQPVAGGNWLRGSVVDARSGEGLSGAVVTLEPTPAGLVAPDAGGFLTVARRAPTDEAGRYRFASVPPGRYRLRIVRLGYRSATLELSYAGDADPTISVGLEVEPVELEPLRVEASRPRPIRSGRDVPDDHERLGLERVRQARDAQTDARTLTSADLVEAVTLGETDLLRALHRLPSVTADDDWSAEPWTRGAHWDETRVYFDGMPLLDAVHAGGVLTSVSPSIVGALTFYPGLQPAWAGASSAGLVDMRTRRASGEERLSALGEVSLLSGRASVERPLANGGGISVSARHSYVENVTRGERALRPEDYVPVRFADYGGRFDHRLSDSLHFELSFLKTIDEVFGDLAETLKGTHGVWGSTALRGTLQLDRSGLRTRATVGGSRYHADLDLVGYDPGRSDLAEAVTAAPLDNSVTFDVAEITVQPLPSSGAPPRWEAGVRTVATDVDYSGPAPWPYPGAVDAGSLEEHHDTRRTALWGQLRQRISGTVDATGGLRVESSAPNGSDGLTVAPRLAVRWRPLGDVTVTGAMGRHHQYEQALAAAGFDVGPALVPTHLWVASRDGVPVLRSDIATLGTEVWLPGGWLASVNAFARRTDGRLTPSPDSGYVRARPPFTATSTDPAWSVGRVRARGIEVGARRLAGRVTGSVSYAWMRSRMTADGSTFPAPGERPRSLDASVLMQVTSGTRIGAAYTATSGAPFTRFYAFRCPVDADPYPAYCPPPGGSEVIGWNERAGAERTSGYASLDVHFDTRGTVFGLPFGFYAQLRNVLQTPNDSAYRGSILRCGDGWGVDCTLEDDFEGGMPLIPLIGLWIRL